MLTCQLVTAVDPHYPEDKSHVCLRALMTGIYGFQRRMYIFPWIACFAA